MTATPSLFDSPTNGSNMRVLVLGGGYAGVVATKRLERRLPEDVELVLVDERDSHLVRHELHRVIRRPDFAETIQIPFETILDRARFMRRRVAAIDPDDEAVTFAGGEELEYDAAILSVGAGPAFYGLEDVREHAITLDSPGDALSIGDHLAELLETEEGEIVVGGAGLAGVQAAGELAEATQGSGADISVTLVEQEPTVAPRFGDGFQARIYRALDDLEIEVRTGTEVTGATVDSVTIRPGESIPADLFVWTGGIQGRSSIDGDRPLVRADLRLGETTFGAGDAVSIVDADGRAVTPSAQTAIRVGRVASRNVLRTVEAKRRGDTFRPRLDRFRQETLAWVVSVGDQAVAKVGPQVLSGRPATALKSTVGLGYLSSAGAIREAVSVVRNEFGFSV